MAVQKEPASLRPRCTWDGSFVAAIPVYQSYQPRYGKLKYNVGNEKRPAAGRDGRSGNNSRLVVKLCVLLTVVMLLNCGAPKFRSFDIAEPNPQFRGKYVVCLKGSVNGTRKQIKQNIQTN
jgi:hypothetical protein